MLYDIDEHIWVIEDAVGIAASVETAQGSSKSNWVDEDFYQKATSFEQ